jgi:hypothetical protein
MGHFRRNALVRSGSEAVMAKEPGFAHTRRRYKCRRALIGSHAVPLGRFRIEQRCVEPTGVARMAR